MLVSKNNIGDRINVKMSQRSLHILHKVPQVLQDELKSTFINRIL